MRFKQVPLTKTTTGINWPPCRQCRQRHRIEWALRLNPSIPRLAHLQTVLRSAGGAVWRDLQCHEPGCAYCVEREIYPQG